MPARPQGCRLPRKPRACSKSWRCTCAACSDTRRACHGTGQPYVDWGHRRAPVLRPAGALLPQIPEKHYACLTMLASSTLVKQRSVDGACPLSRETLRAQGST